MPSRPKRTSGGRGGRYSAARGLVEWSLGRLYAGDWPARAWGRTPWAARVDRLGYRLVVDAPTPRLRLAFASDLHLGPTTARATLDAAFAHLAAADADVLLLGGDYVFLEATRDRLAELTARIRAVPARRKLAVMGNHDLWTDDAAIADALSAAGVELLINDGLRLPPPHDAIAILGLDDPWTGALDVDRALAPIGDAPIKLAFAHAPEALPAVHARGVAALLCGHTHGGQIALPGGRPLIVPGETGKRWPHGRHEVDATSLFVSRGIGGVEVPLRWNARPDVLIVDVEGR